MIFSIRPYLSIFLFCMVSSVFAQSHDVGNVSNLSPAAALSNLSVAQQKLNANLRGRFGEAAAPSTDIENGRVAVKFKTNSVQNEKDLFAWLERTADEGNDRIVSCNGNHYVNIARSGESEQLVRISLPQSETTTPNIDRPIRNFKR